MRPARKLVTLKSRDEFLRLRGGLRFAGRCFVVEGKQRLSSERDAVRGVEPQGPRFGFTVTKKLGNAVVRNRIRRRLKAAFNCALDREHSERFDYVVIARSPSFDIAFTELAAEAARALTAIHAKPMQKNQRSEPKPRP